MSNSHDRDVPPKKGQIETHLGVADHVIAVLFGAVILVTGAQVVCRYVFNRSLTWSEEMAGFLFTWIILLGAAAAIRDGTHIRIDFILERLPKRVVAPLRAASLILIAVFLAATTVLGFVLVARTANSWSPALQLPINLVYYGALPVAFLIGLWYAVRRIIRFVRDGKTGARGDLS